LERLAGTLHISDRVTFTGLIPNDCVAGYAAAADVFVLPSLLEALPTVAVEALASGTPVISADHPGGVELHELFGDDVAIVPRENVDALAHILGDFLRRPTRATSQTAQTIARLFSPAAVVAAFDQVYLRAAQGRA
jgi:rhamnosyl/mannosyltransferase